MKPDDLKKELNAKVRELCEREKLDQNDKQFLMVAINTLGFLKALPDDLYQLALRKIASE